MLKKEVTVYSPATVANMVCGFDILGFALDGPYDKLTIRLTGERGVTIRNLDDFNLPTVPEQNVIGGALLAMLEVLEEGIGFEVDSTKIIKPGSGIGSSAASAAGAVVAANFLLNNRFTKEELVGFAMFGEKVASGAKHADNIAPAIYGGVTLIRSTDPLDIISIPSPRLFVTVLHPLIEVKTSSAREILKKEILLKDAAVQWGNVAGLVAGLMKNDYELISRSLVDHVAEPKRSTLIPGFNDLKQAAMQNGALGAGISGSGPSVFALCRGEADSEAVLKAMKACMDTRGFAYKAYLSPVNRTGAEIC